MNQAIQQIVAAEVEARRCVEKARSDAQEIIAAAERRSREIERRLEEKSRLDAVALLDEALRSAEAQRQTQIATASVKIAAGRTVDPKRRTEAIREALDCICRR